MRPDERLHQSLEYLKGFLAAVSFNVPYAAPDGCAVSKETASTFLQKQDLFTPLL